eukprot:2298803-Amphidinium_carterae.1
MAVPESHVLQCFAKVRKWNTTKQVHFDGAFEDRFRPKHVFDVTQFEGKMRLVVAVDIAALVPMQIVRETDTSLSQVRSSHVCIQLEYIHGLQSRFTCCQARKALDVTQFKRGA